MLEPVVRWQRAFVRGQRGLRRAEFFSHVFGYLNRIFGRFWHLTTSLSLLFHPSRQGDQGEADLARSRDVLRRIREILGGEVKDPEPFFPSTGSLVS